MSKKVLPPAMSLVTQSKNQRVKSALIKSNGRISGKPRAYMPSKHAFDVTTFNFDSQSLSSNNYSQV